MSLRRRVVGQTAEDVRNLVAKRREIQRRETDVRIKARIYKDASGLPKMDLVAPAEPDAMDKELLGISGPMPVPVWNQVVDYEKYGKAGWDPDVIQQIYETVSTGKNAEGRDTYGYSYVYLMPNGDVHPMQSKANRPGSLERNPVPNGKWALEVPKEEAPYSFVQRRYIAITKDGEVDVEFNSTNHDDQGRRYTFAHIINPGTVTPLEIIPVREEREVVQATGKVAEINGKFFTFRNFLGKLIIKGFDGTYREELLCNSDLRTVERHRVQYLSLIPRWKSLDEELRRQIFFNRNTHPMGFLCPRSPYESYLANPLGVTEGRDGVQGFFVPLRKKADGTFEQVEKPTS